MERVTSDSKWEWGGGGGQGEGWLKTSFYPGGEGGEIPMAFPF